MSTFKQFLIERVADLTYQDLDVGKTYWFQDEDNSWFKAKVISIEPTDYDDDDVADVNYEYVDDSYHKKGATDTFEVDINTKAFKKLDENAGRSMKLNQILNEGADYREVGRAIAEELVDSAFEHNKDLFGEDFDYVMDSLAEELPDMIIDKIGQFASMALEKEIKRIQKEEM